MGNIWWPSEEDLKQLSVEETDDGFCFSAPEDTACAKWLSYYTSTPELEKQFKEAVLSMIKSFLEEDLDGK